MRLLKAARISSRDFLFINRAQRASARAICIEKLARRHFPVADHFLGVSLIDLDQLDSVRDAVDDALLFRIYTIIATLL